ncbi:hypothetical protein QYF36_003685 [Acer negundo]|nr:hypothetical protein QYF36_003685 [Acer negundo]
MAIGFFLGAIREEFVSPRQLSFSSVLNACTNVGRSEFGRQVHGLIVKHRDRDVVAWNVMISGCVHSYMFEEACGYFCLMRKESIPANEVSYSTVLHASASLAVLNQGMLIHKS